MIAKYRKKPVVIEAVQYTGDNAEEIFEWMNKTSTCAAYIDPDEDNSLMIITLEGEMQETNFIRVIQKYLLRHTRR
jgi:hypothetical protein